MFDLDRWEEIWATIARNRKRSIMTAFGVFWGIFMLVAMTGAGLGLERKIRLNAGNMATNTCFFFTNSTGIPYNGFRAGRYWSFENEDIDAIKKEAGVKYASGIIWGAQYNFSHANHKGTYQVMGYMPDFQKINPQFIRYGRYINELDMIQERKVCVIGKQVWQDLFPGGENPVGTQIRLNDMYMTVVGVYEPTSANIHFSDDENTVIVPFSTLQRLYNMGDKFGGLAITGYDDIPVKDLETDSKSTIIARHIYISPDDTKAIGGFNVGEQFEQMSKLFLGISLLIWIVGIGTLLAGIVGVSNIMLVVIRERTQEIGVRRALGAKPRVIISQIMSESFVLTFIAGVLGLAAGVGVLSVVDSVTAAGAAASGEPAVSWQIPFGTGILSAGVLVVGSLLAGIIPANRAMRIKPVDAIREE